MKEMPGDPGLYEKELEYAILDDHTNYKNNLKLLEEFKIDDQTVDISTKFIRDTICSTEPRNRVADVKVL